MQFDQYTLDKAAKIGADKVSEALTKISGSAVEANTTNAVSVPLGDCLAKIQPSEDHAVVIYSQQINTKPIGGMALLTLDRENALALVDLLNHQEIGTTAILKDIDRSALRETLNILSNSFMTALSQVAKIEINLGVPNMITSSSLKQTAELLLKKKDNNEDTAIIFEVDITIAKHQVKAKLYLLFNQDFVGIVNQRGGA